MSATPSRRSAAMGRSAYGDDGKHDLSPGYAGGYDLEEQKAARSLLFAGTILGLIGVSDVIAGVAAISDSSVFPRHTVFEFWNIHTWGVIVLVLGIVALYASFAIFTGGSFARTFGMIVAGANAFGQLFFAPAHPVWSITVFAADLLAVKALAAHGRQGLFDK
jgi:hypothetical protein